MVFKNQPVNVLEDQESDVFHPIPQCNPVSYPAHLFQPVPSKLKIDNLRKKVMISQIERARATTAFYNSLYSLMGPLKHFLLSLPKDVQKPN